MYTDLQIDFIRAFGDKELKFGCLVRLSNPKTGKFDDHFFYRVRSHFQEYTDFIPRATRNAENMKSCEILWSEPHLFPDVAKKLREEGWELELGSIGWEYHILVHERGIQEAIIYFNPCLPLLEQPQAMESLLSLIK